MGFKMGSRGQLILFSHWSKAFHSVSCETKREYEMIFSLLRPAVHIKRLEAHHSRRGSVGTRAGALRCCTISDINQHLMFY